MCKTKLMLLALVAAVVLTVGSAFAEVAPKCAPNCYVNYGKCVCLRHEAPSKPVAEILPMLLGDGSDPMPLCHPTPSKPCKGFPLTELAQVKPQCPPNCSDPDGTGCHCPRKEKAVVVAPPVAPLPRDGGPLPMCSPKNCAAKKCECGQK